jgi:hypothetical protein
MYLCDLHFKYIIINKQGNSIWNVFESMMIIYNVTSYPSSIVANCKVIQLMEKYIESNLTLIFLKDYGDYMWLKNMWRNTHCSIYHITSYPHVLQGKNMNLTIPIWEPNSWTLVDTGHPWVNLILNFHSSRVVGWHPCIHPLSVVSHTCGWERCCTII